MSTMSQKILGAGGKKRRTEYDDDDDYKKHMQAAHEAAHEAFCKQKTQNLTAIIIMVDVDKLKPGVQKMFKQDADTGIMKYQAEGTHMLNAYAKAEQGHAKAKPSKEKCDWSNNVNMTEPYFAEIKGKMDSFSRGPTYKHLKHIMRHHGIRKGGRSLEQSCKTIVEHPKADKIKKDIDAMFDDAGRLAEGLTAKTKKPHIPVEFDGIRRKKSKSDASKTKDKKDKDKKTTGPGKFQFPWSKSAADDEDEDDDDDDDTANCSKPAKRKKKVKDSDSDESGSESDDESDDDSQLTSDEDDEDDGDEDEDEEDDN